MKSARPARAPILRALLRMLDDRHAIPQSFSGADVEDAIMATMLRVLEWEETEDNGADLKENIARRYAARAVRNRLLDDLQKHRQLQSATEELQESTFVVSENESRRDVREYYRIAKGLLDELSLDNQALLKAYFTSREEYHEECLRLGLRRGTARVRIHRILKRLLREGSARLALQKQR